MGIDQVDQTVVTEAPVGADGQETVRTASRHTTVTGPGGAAVIRRTIVFIFGLIQLVIVLRIVLLLLDARQANAIVSGILDVSQLFVAPFNGILGRDALHSAGSILDLAAIVAFVGWSIIEMVVLWGVGIFRRGPA